MPSAIDPGKSVLELPAALVEELLAKNDSVGFNLLKTIEEIQSKKDVIRDWLETNDILNSDVDIEDVDIPTTCAVDGSYVMEHMLSTSVVACAAVAIEGFSPPSETKHWPLKYESLIEVESHESELSNIIRGLMKVMETKLAVNAPHDVILSDGSITSQIIHMNQAIHSANSTSNSGSLKTVDKKLLESYKDFLTWFGQILDASDGRTWASLPKYTSRSEIGYMFDKTHGWPQKQDDRSVLTAVLKPGEYTTSFPITTPKDQWHLATYDDSNEQEEIEVLIKNCLNAMKRQMVFYYKPYEYSPALRIEVGGWINSDKTRLAKLLKSIKFQYASYAIMEPYPLYMADRMVKSLSSAIPTLRQAALQKIADGTSADVKDILFSIRGYRTESGH